MIIVSEQDFFCPDGADPNFAYGQAILSSFESLEAFKDSLDSESPKEWGISDVFVAAEDGCGGYENMEVSGTLYTWIEV